MSCFVQKKKEKKRGKKKREEKKTPLCGCVVCGVLMGGVLVIVGPWQVVALWWLWGLGGQWGPSAGAKIQMCGGVPGPGGDPCTNDDAALAGGRIQVIVESWRALVSLWMVGSQP